ncbi:unnamed protein product [Symbiodinium natans]|uniref:Uncharacterized protein n=1 Tax=Symbiodinium natans TaxID=878477 RepID=A0A812U734_9DINO|nr:unnamed protein product [Symbiodinium natans]
MGRDKDGVWTQCFAGACVFHVSNIVAGPCGLPDLLTGRRSQGLEGKEENSKEACGNGREGSEPQPPSEQEMKKDSVSKKATAAEEREAFLQALMQDRAEADRGARGAGEFAQRA